jgi:hypothetical protein
VSLLPDSMLARLRAIRATQFTETGVIHRSPGGRQTGDARDWPVHHSEAGLLKSSRETVTDAEGRLVAATAPTWVTSVDSATDAGDLLAVGDRWFTVAGPPRAQTVQTGAVYPLAEVVYGS